MSASMQDLEIGRLERAAKAAQHVVDSGRWALLDERDVVVYIGTCEDRLNSEAGLPWVALTEKDVHVRLGYKYDFKKREFIRIRRPVEVERNDILLRINQVYHDKVGGLLSSFDEYEIMTFPFQFMAIIEHRLNMTDGICQHFLRGLSDGRVEGSSSTIEAIIRAGSQPMYLIGLATGTRHTFEKRAWYVQDHAQLDELDAQITEWENTTLIPS